MAQVILRSTLFAVVLLGLHCWTTAADSESRGIKTDDASPKTKQTFIAVARPNNFWNLPRYPQRLQYRQYPFYNMKPKSTAAPPPDIDLGLLLFAFYLAIRQSNADPVTTTTVTVTTPTTATTTMTTAVECEWETWGTCSRVCRGTRTRSKICNGVVEESQSEDCNTEAGFQDDGWYRATNCLEYQVIGAAQNYFTSNSYCEDTLSGRLASTGMRDDTTRPEILEKLFQANGIVRDAYIGVDDRTTVGTYEWSDGVEEMPTFWNQFQPDTSSHRCHIIIFGNPRSLNDVACSTNHFAICEREIP